MPKIMPNVTPLSSGGLQVSWSGIKSGDVCVPVGHSELKRRCIQVSGDFSGATLSMQGSQDTIDYNSLNDANGTPMDYQEGVLAEAQQVPIYVRPHLEGGDSNSNLTVVLTLEKE